MCEVLKEADGGAEIILVEVYRFPVCNKLVFLVARKVIKIIVASPQYYCVLASPLSSALHHPHQEITLVKLQNCISKERKVAKLLKPNAKIWSSLPAHIQVGTKVLQHVHVCTKSRSRIWNHGRALITIFPAQVRFSFLLSKRFSFVQTRRNVNAFLRLMHIFTWNLILGGLSGCKEFRLYQNVSSVCWDLCHSRDLPFFSLYINGGLTLPSQMMRR